MCGDTAVKKVILIIASAVVLLTVCFCVSIPIVNDMYAKRVADELSTLPLPENTRIAEKMSAAAKLWGNGNGMQYMGALLIESELPLDELEEFYSESTMQCRISRQDGKTITVTEHGNYGFNTEIDSDNYYIVYALGSDGSALRRLYAELDLRGH